MSKKKSRPKPKPLRQKSSKPMKARAPKKPPAKKKPGAARKASRGKASPPKAARPGDGHPQLAKLTAALRPGRYAGGLLLISRPGEWTEELGPWLLGNLRGRVALGRTAFGEFVVFRDLRERARELGDENADEACDVAVVDIHYKRMRVIGLSGDEFLAGLDDEEFQRAHLRLDLFKEAKKRLGDYADDECFAFVPALALGGTEAASSVARQKWKVHQALLLQT